MNNSTSNEECLYPLARPPTPDPVRNISYLVVLPIISIIGIITGVICLIVFTRKQMRFSFFFSYYETLSVIEDDFQELIPQHLSGSTIYCRHSLASL